MKNVKKLLVIFITVLLMSMVAKTQQVDSVEYFLNTDPGFGNATGILTTHAADISNLSFNVNTASLSRGFNNLYVRSHSSNGHWSATQRWLFFKDIVPASNINRLEYFIDNDPGFGNATNISITTGAVVPDVSFSVDISSLSRGHHSILIRSRDNNGNWSITGRWLFFKDILPSANINRLEYFIDTDPGFGNATTVSIMPAANIPDQAFAVDISSLSFGAHQILLRSRDNAGNWSISNRWVFFKDRAPSANVNRVEYFVDTDPGFGNATTVSISAASNIPDISFTVDVTGLTNGMHNIFVRSKDNNGNWSLVNKWLFFKDRIPASNVSKMEYFTDVDPGFGNGTDVPVSAAASLNDINIAVNTTALTEGFHKIFLRSRDNNGSWAITSFYGFFKEFRRSPLNVKTGEYFFDADPGFGNGINIPFADPKGNNIADFNFPVDLTSLLNNAPHYLFVRVLDSSNKWSVTNVVEFMKSVVVPVSWLSFNARPVNRQVLLDWKTATESNSRLFEIEHSVNGQHFQQIGTVNAAGNSNDTRSYNFTHTSPVKGINYYRLKQVDLDGQYKYSEVRTAEISYEEPLLVVYNNPSNGKGITIKTNIAPSMLGIFDMSGKKLKEISLLAHTQQADLSAFPSGVYHAVLYKDGKVIAVEKIVIRH